MQDYIFPSSAVFFWASQGRGKTWAIGKMSIRIICETIEWENYYYILYHTKALSCKSHSDWRIRHRALWKKKNIYFPVQSQYKKLAECSSHYSILRILPLMCIIQLGKWQRRQFEFLSITDLGKYCFSISHSKLCSRQGFNLWNTLLELDVKLNQFKRPFKFYYNKVRI